MHGAEFRANAAPNQMRFEQKVQSRVQESVHCEVQHRGALSQVRPEPLPGTDRAPAIHDLQLPQCSHSCRRQNIKKSVKSTLLRSQCQSG